MHPRLHTVRSTRPVRIALACLLVGTVVTPVAGQGQILRPQADSPDSAILRSERVARLAIELPVEPEVAWDAWTDANQFVQWLPQWAEMQVTEEGTFEMGWQGYEGVWSGTYLEVERPERLSFSWLPPESTFPAGAYETTVTLTFEESEEGGTTMTLEHSGFRGVEELEAQLQSWRQYLFALRAFVLQPRVSGE